VTDLDPEPTPDFSVYHAEFEATDIHQDPWIRGTKGPACGLPPVGKGRTTKPPGFDVAYKAHLEQAKAEAEAKAERPAYFSSEAPTAPTAKKRSAAAVGSRKGGANPTEVQFHPKHATSVVSAGLRQAPLSVYIKQEPTSPPPLISLLSSDEEDETPLVCNRRLHFKHSPVHSPDSESADSDVDFELARNASARTRHCPGSCVRAFPSLPFPAFPSFLGLKFCVCMAAQIHRRQLSSALDSRVKLHVHYKKFSQKLPQKNTRITKNSLKNCLKTIL
jgi:hypothetical protein